MSSTDTKPRPPEAVREYFAQFGRIGHVRVRERYERDVDERFPDASPDERAALVKLRMDAFYRNRNHKALAARRANQAARGV
jgi:hypothetical protein